MRVVRSDKHRLHDPRIDLQAGVAAENVERPPRAERIYEVLKRDSTFTIEAPTEHGLEPIEAVHAAGLVRFLQQAWGAWRSAGSRGAEMFPDTIMHPGFRDEPGSTPPEPVDLIGRLGYWCFDTGTPILSGTYPAARAAVDVALTAADLVLAGERSAYGLCRPPGHHAARAMYGGFCYFNNAAIAAEYLARQTASRVAVVDLDYHHGNGTQQIFYRRGDVLYVSVHGDPRRAYPYFSGHASETGAGPGAGLTLNLPLPAGSTNERYLGAMDKAIEALVRFAPEVTVISFGVDSYGLDPLGDFALTTSVYRECGKRLAAGVRRVVVIQEGGYYLPDLGENVRQFLLGFQSRG